MGEKFPSRTEGNFKTHAGTYDNSSNKSTIHGVLIGCDLNLITVPAFSPTKSFYDKVWANELLRYAIKVSKGECFKSPDGVRLSCLIRLHQSLVEHHYTWQGKILNYHIHRFQKEHKTTQTPEGLTTKERGGLSKKLTVFDLVNNQDYLRGVL